MHIYGPVLSRRLGYSLGIDIVGHRACTLNCIYCQIGSREAVKPLRQRFYPPQELENELLEKIPKISKLDYITFAGTGEPTLSLDLGRFILFIKNNFPKIKVAVLTNGSLLSNEDVRNELLLSDLVVPSLDSGDEDTWQKVNRPCKDLKWENYIDGLVKFSEEFQGHLKLEIMLLKSLNDSDESLGKFKQILEKIHLDEIDINTPVRPPAEDWAKIPDDERVEKAKKILGAVVIGKKIKGKQEIASAGKQDITSKGKQDIASSDDISQRLVDFLSRRPETLEAMEKALTYDKTEIEEALLKMLRENILTKSIHEGSVFYWKR